MKHNTLFPELDMLKVDVTFNDISYFISAMDNFELPDIFVLRLDECDIKINRKLKEFRLLNINDNKCNRFQYLDIAKAMKLAKRSGYKIFFEPKYMN